MIFERSDGRLDASNVAADFVEHGAKMPQVIENQDLVLSH